MIEAAVAAQEATTDDPVERLAHSWHLGQTGRANEALSEALDIHATAGKIGDVVLEAHASVKIAWYCFQLGNTEQGLLHAQQAAQFFATIRDAKHEAQARALLAWHLLEIGLIDDAIDYSHEAVSLADKDGDLLTRSMAMNVSGVVSWGLRQTDRAIAACSKAVDLAREADNPSFVCLWMINLGGAHMEAADIAGDRNDNESVVSHMQSALRFTTEARLLAIELGDPWAERICTINRAEIHFVRGDNLAAVHDLQSYQLKLAAAYQRDQEAYLDLYGRAMIALGRHDEAIEALTECLQMGERSGKVETMLQSCRNMANAYEALKNYEKALEFYKRYHALHLQLTEERAQKKARLAEVHYEVDKLKARADNEARRADDIAGSYQALQLRAAALADAAELDPLTGLFNRRRLERMLSELDGRIEPYSVAMIDIDHFKSINDGHSHMIGDLVLKQLAQLIRQMLDSDCMAARFGGEEFTLLLPGKSDEEAHRICETIRQTVERWLWAQISPGLSVTISLGIAASSQASDARNALQIADQHLYRAKTSGRNRVSATIATAA